MSCGWLDWATTPGKCASETVKSAVGDAIEKMANAVMKAYGTIMASLGTMRVHIGTPNLRGTGGTFAIEAGSSSENSSNLTMVLS